MIKRSDKRGDQQSWIIGFILVIAIGALILFFASDAFGKVKGVVDIADLDVGLLSQRCEAQISVSPGESYCAEKIKIKSNSYITCPYAIDNFGVTTQSTPPKCDEEKGAKSICKKLLAEDLSLDPKKLYVNEKLCYSEKDDKGNFKNPNWEITREGCYGTAKECSKIDCDDEEEKCDDCASQEGCIWSYEDSECTGEPTPCYELNKDKCGEDVDAGQKGCYWYSEKESN
jgi:hypothetical protein